MNTLPRPTHPGTPAFVKQTYGHPLWTSRRKGCPSFLTFKSVFRLFKTHFVSDTQDHDAIHWAFGVASNFVPPCLMRSPANTLGGKVFQRCLGRAFGNLLALTLTSSMGRNAHPNSTLFYHGSYLAFMSTKTGALMAAILLCNLHATTRCTPRRRHKNMLRMAV